ncbi:MAG: hypothetical protein ISP01_07290 [Methanobrevibacter arboriphilus]|uniref:Uncharacterized protein n=1 Tax=Methanobrevibacter arboriphilus TaxID=39441 RepID=A0A843AJH3_METAZ|nr:hypothetical protein [Methanobrevibacter arboriphilus]MBF4469195.1 hypothetical protein [Methanobrevibacter arboriphilus]
MNKKIIILTIIVILGVVAVSGCIGGNQNSTNTITFNGYSFEVPREVTGDASVEGSNALLFLGNTTFDIGTNETYGYVNPNELISEGTTENRTVDNITYLYNSQNGNPDFNQENLITIQVFFTKNNVQYYILVHAEKGQNISQIDSIIQSIIKTIKPI